MGHLTIGAEKSIRLIRSELRSLDELAVGAEKSRQVNLTITAD